MPLYEYQCEPCGHRFEKIRKFSDPPFNTCPVCGGPVQKLVSSPAIQFKGTGWYITDYAKKSSKDASSSTAPKDTSESSTDSSATKSDAPASKPDPPSASAKKE
jgi:putative FmdB family regulatory protein